MTTLIQQKSASDCVLAAIAMAAGCASWNELWTEADLKSVVDSKGIADESPWLERAGLLRNEHYRTVRIWGDCEVVQKLLWKRKALIACNSLNNLGGQHMVYWDGERVWDPHEGHWHLGWQYYKHITSLMIKEVILFDEHVPRVPCVKAPPAVTAEV